MKQRISIILIVVLALGMFSGCKNTTSEAEPDATKQWEVLEEAYCYTFPLVMMEYSKIVATNAEEPDGKGHAPVNQLIHAQNLANAQFKAVVTPNVDTVYTQAWLDLSEEPMVYIKPEADRFFQMQVLDAWTNTPAVLKEAGIYLFTTSDWKGSVPEGMIQVVVPTQMVWMLGRVVVDGESDLKNVYDIQNQMQLLPLSAYESGTSYTAPKGEYKEENDLVPVNAVLTLNPQDYFATANRLMVTNPPAKEDAEILERIAAVNVGPGLTFDSSKLQGDIGTQWKAMLQSLPDKLKKVGTEFDVKIGSWEYYGEPIANFGTEYDYRAMVALGGLGANPVDVALYLKTYVDSDNNQMNSENSYLLHFDTLPPVVDDGFWSVTAYGSDNFLIDNELNRYCINDRSDYVLNEDGTLDVILSADKPENEANWLPIGSGDIHLFMRIYQPDMTVIDAGWKSPVITKLQ